MIVKLCGRKEESGTISLLGLGYIDGVLVSFSRVVDICPLSRIYRIYVNFYSQY